MMRTTRLLCLALLAGCGNSPHALSPTMCTKNCPLPQPSLLIAAEIAPATGGNSSFPIQETGTVSVDSGAFTLTLEAPVQLTGSVKALGAHAVSVAATVVATRPSRIAGRPDVYYQSKVDATTGEYALALSPTHAGEMYTVRVISDAAALYPPQLFHVEATADQKLDLLLDDPAMLVQLHGVITDALQSPVTGMQVEAVDPVTQALVSTTALTDGAGAFAIRLSRSVSGSIKLVAAPTATAAWGLPTLELPVNVSKLGPTNSLTANLQVPPLRAPTELKYQVVGVGSSGAEESVVGATCQFSADISDPKSPIAGLVATYTVSTVTDADGNAIVKLVPAQDVNRDYHVAVSPPATSDFGALLSSAITVGPQASGVGAKITLILRPQLSGRVLGPDRQPIKNLQVTPSLTTVAASLTNGASAALAPKLSSALTDGEGRFVLRLDSGTYDVGLIPPSSAGLPRLWIDSRMVTSDTALPDAVLPHGTLVSGVLVDPDGQAVVGAGVRLYTLSPANVACKTADYACLAPPRLSAEGSTGSDGSVRLLLPAATAAN